MTAKQTRIIALFLTLVVLLAATKMRTAEVPRPPGGEPRICQYDADSLAAAPDRYILRTYDTATYLSPQARRVPQQSPTSFSPSYRGPPELL